MIVHFVHEWNKNDHLFSFSFFTLHFDFWHMLFKLSHLDCVLPKNIYDYDMMLICNKGLGNFIKGKVLWQITCLLIIWVVWKETNARIFKEQEEDFKYTKS